MNLQNKKELAARTLGVGKKRIIFNEGGLSEIKEAITKEDIRTLLSDGIISLKPISGRRKVEKRSRKRGPGKIKKKIKKRKQDYVRITRKLRRCIKKLFRGGKITREVYKDLRKKIKMSEFRSQAHLREYLDNVSQVSEKKEKKFGEKSEVVKEKLKKPRKIKENKK
jgi:large subunit ribosomal protein L19e